jgi:phosphate transport system substrate-binding protein
MTFTLLKNKDGNFVPPSDTAFKAAAAGADWSKTFYQITTEQPGKDSWPITNPTYILMHKTQDKPEVASQVLKFFNWAFVNGDKASDDLDYVPLPDSVKALVAQRQWSQIKDSSGKAVAFK